MKYFVSTIITALLTIHLGYSQNIDNATKNKVKVKFINAEEYYSNNDFQNTLKKINEIEQLMGNKVLPNALNLKIKALVGLRKYSEAKKELSVLENFELEEAILKDLAVYSKKINQGIEYEELRLKKIKEQKKQLLAKVKGKFYDGLAKIELNGKYGFINRIGEIVIPIKFDRVDQSNGLVRVKRNNKWGYFNNFGEIVIPIKFDYLGLFEEELVTAKLNKKWGYFDKSGDIFIPIKYDNASNFKNDRARVRLGEKCGAIDKKGKVRVQIKYSNCGNFEGNYAYVKLGEFIPQLGGRPDINTEKYGIVDKNGKIIVPLKYKNYDSIRQKLEQLNKMHPDVVPNSKLATWVNDYGFSNLKTLAEHGDPIAQRRLARYYTFVNVDLVKKVYWLQKSAKQGDYTSQNNLGYAYFKGSGVTKDKEKAVYWYLEAIKHEPYGIAYATNGLIDIKGREWVNKTKTVWYLKEAPKGNSTIQYYLGLWYEKGYGGLSKNLSKAIKWYTRSANQGFLPAINKRRDIKDNLGY